MIKFIKIGDDIFEYIEPYTVISEEENIVSWFVPDDPDEYRLCMIDTIKYLCEQRRTNILHQYHYLDFTSVEKKIYQDPNAKFIIEWYKTYTHLICTYIQSLSNITDIYEMIEIDLKQTEEDIYNESLNESPLPHVLTDLNGKKLFLRNKIYIKRKFLEQRGIQIQDQQSNIWLLDTSETGRSNLQGTLLSYQSGLLSQENDNVMWKFMNGFKEINYNNLLEMSGFVLDYIEKLFQAEGLHYMNISNITTIEEIDNYDIEQYWPSDLYVSETIS